MSTAVSAEPMVGASPQRVARMAGGLYLIGSFAGVFGILYGPSLVVPGDAAATARHLLASEALFRLSIVSALLCQILFIFVALALYQLLKAVNQNMAVLMVILMLLSIPIAMLNELNNVAIVSLVSGAGPVNAFSADQQHALVPLFLNLHALGLDISFLAGALWFFALGYLVFRSGFLPRILAVLLMVNGLAYTIDSVTAILRPDLNVNLVMFTGWVEVVFALWLVIRGVNVERWETQTPAAA